MVTYCVLSVCLLKTTNDGRRSSPQQSKHSVFALVMATVRED